MSTDKMNHTYQIHGLPLQTGDIICTMNSKPDILPGEFWRLVGRLVPGDRQIFDCFLYFEESNRRPANFCPRYDTSRA